MNDPNPTQSVLRRFVTLSTRWFSMLLAIFLWTVLGVAWVWASLAIWFSCPWTTWASALVTISWAVAAAWCCVHLNCWKAWRVIAAGILCVWLIWSLQCPSNDRAWTADQARMPQATFDGDTVTIENLRQVSYHSSEEYDVRWQRRQFDLGDIERVDFVVEHFSSWRGPAHTFLTFGFADGQHVAISVEIRKEQGESFSALKGAFRQYEIMYVIGDERDLIGLRVNYRNNPVYVYPIKATEEQVRHLFVSMLERANGLTRQPEFYNTLTNTCTTNIVRHMEDLTGEELPMNMRVLFPGYSDSLAFDLGLVDYEGSLEQARRRFRIPACPSEKVDGREWSRQIRQDMRE